MFPHKSLNESLIVVLDVRLFDVQEFDNFQWYPVVCCSGVKD